MTDVQKGVFLTITDLLGKRSYLQNEQYLYTARPSSCNTFQETDCTYGCDVNQYSNGWYGCQRVSANDCYRLGHCSITGIPRTGPLQAAAYTAYPSSCNNYQQTDCTYGCYANGGHGCQPVSGTECYRLGQCLKTQAPRWPSPDHYGTYAETALDHVTKVYAVRDSDSCGGSGNRMFFAADDALIFYIRNKDFGLPEWQKSNDLLGPHAPFTNDSETRHPRPEGQMHFWSWDSEVRSLSGAGVDGVYDPHVVEIDIDYNSRHHSNPQCYYDNLLGRYYYERHWRGDGIGGSAELDYNPCVPASPNRIDDQRFFVWQQYWDHFGRTPDKGGMAGWLSKIQECGSDAQCLVSRRTETARGFIDSVEFRKTRPALQNPGTPEYNREFVRQCYLVYLRREPGSGDAYDAWLDQLTRTGDEHAIVYGFIYSQEYRARFGQP